MVRTLGTITVSSSGLCFPGKVSITMRIYGKIEKKLPLQSVLAIDQI